MTKLNRRKLEGIQYLFLLRRLQIIWNLDHCNYNMTICGYCYFLTPKTVSKKCRKILKTIHIPITIFELIDGCGKWKICNIPSKYSIKALTFNNWNRTHKILIIWNLDFSINSKHSPLPRSTTTPKGAGHFVENQWNQTNCFHNHV